MKANNEYANITSSFEDDFKKDLEILNLFNLFYQISYKDYYTELIIPKDEKFIFEKVKNKLKLLEEIATKNDENTEPFLAITVFKILFMKEKEFNLEDFYKKKKYFNIILNTMTNKILDKEEENNVRHLISEIWNTELRGLTLKLALKDYRNILFPFSFYIIKNYSKSRIILTDIFILFLTKKFISANNTDLKLMKSYSEEELEKIPINNLAKNFETIYDNLQNFIIFYVKEGNLKIKKMTMDVMNEKIKESSGSIKQGKKKNDLIQKRDSNKSLEEINKNLIYLKLEINNKFDDISFDLKKNSEKLENKIEAQNKWLDHQMKILEKSMEANLKKLDNEITNLKKEYFSHNKRYKKMQNSLINVNKHLEKVSDKLIDMEYELRLIQLRDPLKNIIDIFCNVLNISLYSNYYDKIQQIKQKLSLKFLNKKKYESIIYFFDHIYDEFISSNDNACSLKTRKYILSKIFSHIDPDERLKYLRIALESGKLNSFLNNFVDNNSGNEIDK